MKRRIEQLINAPLIVNGDCWEWPLGRMAKGYGLITIRGRRWLAHRLIYTVMVGEIENGLMVCHRCDNPACVRPAHLFLGTAADNVRDMVSKQRWGRHARPRGEGHHKAKLTDDVVREIRRLHRAGESVKAIADRFGVDAQHVRRIARGEAWGHVA